MPVLGHADGLCSLYLHHDADAKMAADVIVDSKTDYPAACNALETLLVHENALSTILPSVASALISKGVTLKCDAKSKQALSSVPEQDHIQDSTEKDYDTEFLDLILAVRAVSSPLEAVEHINTHGSHHTDAIVTASKEVADMFLNSVDAACKFWNASTRFCDGMRFGFGTEVGISTNKVHARGPVGLEGLTIHEYRISGNGQVAASYGSGAGKQQYKHVRLPID